MLNHKNIKKVIALLETIPDERFNIAYMWDTVDSTDTMTKAFAEFQAGCGTAACIAGWTYAIMPKEEEESASGAYNAAAIWLGLDENQAHDLFMPSGWSYIRSPYTRQKTIETLKRLDRTSRVEWKV